MDAQAVRDFALRDWRRVERSKRDYWASRLRTAGPEVLFSAAEHLRSFVQSIHPDWPTPAQREADLAHHVRMNRLLDAARDAFTRG